MSRKRRAVAAAAVLAGAMALAACGGGGSAGSGGDANTVKIGFAGDLSGKNSGIVIPGRNGARLAVDEYNATNPAKKIELEEYDTQGDASQATPILTKAVTSDKIAGLIGPAFSGESKATGKLLDEGKVPNISQSATNPGLANNGWKYWHRIVANDNDQGPAVADYLIRTRNAKTAFVINDDQEYSVGIADAAAKEFAAKGVQVSRDQIVKGASDFSSTVTKVKAGNPDVIFYGGYAAEAGPLTKQLRDGGVTAPFSSGDGSTEQSYIDSAGAAAAEGAILSCPCIIPIGTQTGKLKELADKYKAKFGTDPGIYFSEGYDAATLFINAVKAGNTTGEAINNFLSTVSLDGYSKQIKFKPNGEVQATDIFIYTAKAGKLASLGKASEAK
ncbi:MAG TPA: branched-chain amino acid ABC transporter substrate-binding protein [Pseudonocardia sp.]|nr:branched-chain amino acid ABC transporter substrate-binding protein [Pseudonocardia sp.]